VSSSKVGSTVSSSGFYPYIPGGRSLRPVKNTGGENSDKVADQNFPLFSLSKLHP